MTRFILCAMLGALLLVLASCNGGSSEWTVYDVTYADAQMYDVTTCIVGAQQLQGNHNGWEDPQPDHGKDSKHGPNWRKWWKKWCDKNGKPEPEPQPVCDTELHDIPAYFILRHAGLETLYVSAADLLVYRDGMTMDDELVALHYMDLQSVQLRYYPDFLFDIDGNILPEAYLEWMNLYEE